MALRYPPLAPSNFPLSQEDEGKRTTESPIDHAMTLMLAGELESALRWSAAALERTSSPGALLVTSRLLYKMGHKRAAMDGLRLAMEQAVNHGDMPLAVATVEDMRSLGADVTEDLDNVARAFSSGSTRLIRPGGPPSTDASPPDDFVRPLSAFLAGPALASRAEQTLRAVKRAHDESVGADLPKLLPAPVFSALSKEALRDLLSTFRSITVAAGHRIVREGMQGTAAYLLARGEVEISRRVSSESSELALGLARLGRGAFFGEATLAALPSASSAIATRPSILLFAKPEALAAVATQWPEVAAQVASHARRNSLANLGWTPPVVAALPPLERAKMVDRLELRVFERGDRLVQRGQAAQGLHVVVSGEVAVVAREWNEHVLLATLGAGETVGEMEVVLCRHAVADAIAVRPTATLFLSRDAYTSLVQDHPAILHGLYSIAVQRHAETRFVLESGSGGVADARLLESARESRAPTATAAAKSPPPPPIRAVSRTLPPVPRRVSMPTSLPPTRIPPPNRTFRPAAGTFSPSTRFDWFAPTASAGFLAFAAALVVVLNVYGRSATPSATAALEPYAPIGARAGEPAPSPTVVAPAPAQTRTASESASATASAAPARPVPGKLSKPVASAPPKPTEVVVEPSPAAEARAARDLSVSADDFGGRQ